MNIFIVAAGFGERIRPITLDIPKPMLPIMGKPIIDFIIEKSLALNPTNICINIHYKKEVFLRWAEWHHMRDRIRIYPETEILGTGGALKNAEELLLSEDVFIVHNADVLSDIDLSVLVKAHDNSQYIATLCVIDFPDINTLQINKEGLLSPISDVQRVDCCRRTFTGIAIYSSAFLAFLPEGSSSVVEGWLRAIEAGQKIKTLDVTGTYWSDIGSFNAYAQTVFTNILREGEQVYIDRSFKDCSGVDYEGMVVIERNCSASAPLTIKNSIVMPGTRIDKPMTIKDSIVGNNYCIPINPKLSATLGSGGSDRTFSRTSHHSEGNVVKMQCKQSDIDYKRHIEYTKFFTQRGIRVPRLIDFKTDQYWALFEDLGDLSLYNWMRCNRDEESIIHIYDQVIEVIVALHTIEEDRRKFRDFDYQYFLWEGQYFLENYVKALRGITSLEDGVIDDLKGLAERASSFKTCIIHRDLQSQNIMIKNNSIFLIDYQGARLAPPAYDVASLCYDPYVSIDDQLRVRLCEIYIHKRLQEEDFDVTEFRKSLTVCIAQRLMQAIGAYSFLAIKRHKRYFLRHIPNALRLLKTKAPLALSKLPNLKRLIEQL